MKNIYINNQAIGINHKPYIIAELSANHNGDINRALKIIEKAKDAGADAVKIQTYTPDTLTLDCDSKDFQIEKGLWKGRSLYELYRETHLPWDWHQALFEKAKNLGITLFSSPFDLTAVDFLEKLNAPAYKIASFEAIDLPLIKRVAQTAKPMLISTGMANQKEIFEAITTAKENGCDDVIILHCISGYPTPAEQYNLKTLQDMQNRFGVLTGLSDHTLSNETAITSIALGACVIEKHVTLNRKYGGADDSFSLEPHELHSLCLSTKLAWQSLGKVNYELAPAEKNNIKFRRSLYIIKDIKKGEILTKEHVRCIRPGFGILPKYIDSILGKKVNCDIQKGTAISWQMFY